METEKKVVKYIPDVRPEDFHWVVFGIGAGVLFVLTVAAFAIVRIADGMWLSWQLPAIMGIAFLVLVSVVAMLLTIKTVKQELDAKKKSE